MHANISYSSNHFIVGESWAQLLKKIATRAAELQTSQKKASNEDCQSGVALTAVERGGRARYGGV